MRALDAERVEHAANVVAGALLRVALDVLGNVRWRIAARIVGDAAVAAREMPELRLPAPVVPREFVDEDHRRAAARLFVIKLDAVVGRDGWHAARLPDR